MSVRDPVSRSSNHFRMSIPTQKNSDPTPCESMLEGMFSRICELSPQVRSYEVQPSQEKLAVEGRIERYTPDFRVQFTDGSEGWFEVKPAARLKVLRVAQRMAAAQSHFSLTDRHFRVVTDTWLYMEPRAKNVLELMYHRRGVLTPIECERFQRELQSAQPKTLAELCSLLGDDDAWRLLGLGVVGVDLEREITPEAIIYLEGGHRHANLLA